MEDWLTHQIGKLLRARRKDLGLSLGDLSKNLGMTTGSLVRIERGLVDVDLCVLQLLASELDYELNTLVEEAYSRDDERVLLVGEDFPESFVARGLRHVLSVASPSDVLEVASHWRLDVIVFAVEPSADIVRELRSKHSHTQRLSAVTGELLEPALVVFPHVYNVATMDALAYTIDSILLNTCKGLVCSLRRRSDSLGLTRARLQSKNARLLGQANKLVEQLEKLEEQQQKLEQLSMQNAGAWLPALAKQRETLAKVRAGLEKHKQALEAQRIASEQRSRFLARRYTWIQKDLDKALSAESC